jgi:hypothetical protein
MEALTAKNKENIFISEILYIRLKDTLITMECCCKSISQVLPSPH